MAMNTPQTTQRELRPSQQDFQSSPSSPLARWRTSAVRRSHTSHGSCPWQAAPSTCLAHQIVDTEAGPTRFGHDSAFPSAVQVRSGPEVCDGELGRGEHRHNYDANRS